MKKLTKRLFIVSMAIIATGCQSLQLPTPEVGQTFQKVFVFDRDNAAIPLPEGRWTLAGYSQHRASHQGLIRHAVLAQTNRGDLAKFIDVRMQSTLNSYGWELRTKNCFGDDDEDQEWILATKVIANFPGDSGGFDCWKIEAWRIGKQNELADDNPWNQSIDYYRKHGISTGETAVVVNFVKSTPRKLLYAYYGFNPQVDGDLTYSQNQNWQKSRYYQDKKREDYIEEKEDWAEQWRLKVADGIKGKLPVPTAQSATNRLSNLQQLLDDGVISTQDFEKKKQEILDSL